MFSKILHKIAGLAACILLLSACGGRGGDDFAQPTVLGPVSVEADITQELRDDIQTWQVGMDKLIAAFEAIVILAPKRPENCDSWANCPNVPGVGVFKTKVDGWCVEATRVYASAPDCKGSAECELQLLQVQRLHTAKFGDLKGMLSPFFQHRSQACSI